jgi:hypothetical protein
MVTVFLLLYADDQALLSQTGEGLQTALATLGRYCYQNYMNVNTDKTKAIVFTNSRILKSINFQFTYNNQNIELVDSFKYLGMWFENNLKFNEHIHQTISKGYRSMYALLNKIKYTHYSIEVIINLYDALVNSVLMYGCEMWGISAESSINKLNIIENKFYKNVFRLPIRFSTTFVIGELGIYPIDIKIKIRVIKYWLKLCYNEINTYSTKL